MKFLQQEDSLVLVPETVKYIGGDLEQHFLRNITMCSILLDGKQGVAVEVILGRPVFSSFLTVNKKGFSHENTIYPGDPTDLHADVPEPDDQQLHRPVRHHGRPS